jgi:predicted O-methyltransferase YrrM
MNSSYNNNLTYKELLKTITFIKNPKTIVEFGILEGFSLEVFLQNSNSTCQIKAYDIFEDFNGNASKKDQILKKFSEYKNVNIEYGDFYKKFADLSDNSIDILHIDIANNGDVLEFVLKNYFPKLTENGLLIFEGGSEERDNIEWMNKYNKSKIKTVLEKYKDKYNIKTIGNIPSITLIYKLNEIFTKENESTEKNCEYVSIRGIAQNCDIFPKVIISDTDVFDENDYNNIKSGDAVFVITSVLDKFSEVILPKLGDKTIKLVTGACVKGVPYEISNIHSKNYIELFNGCISHWFTQNFDGTDECIPIPLGIDYHTLQIGNCEWGSQTTAISQEKTLTDIRNNSMNFTERKIRTLSTFHFLLFERHNRDRHMAMEVLNEVKFNDIIRNKIPREKLWKLMSKYKFIISPHGNGLDCHRTYESILLGCIPIVKSSTLDTLYKDMPVLILSDWSELTEEKIINYIYHGLFEKLKLNYWTNLIKRSP